MQILLILASCLVAGVAADSCESGECQPVPGNLLIGRADLLKASSEKSEHPASNLVSSDASSGLFESEDGVEDVTITLGLEAEMQLSSIRIEFPGAEEVPSAITFSRSNDDGQRFRSYHYAARDCADALGMDPGRRTAVKDIVCETLNGSVSAVEFAVVPAGDKSPPDERYFFSKVTNVSVKLSGLNSRSSRRSFRVTRLLVAGSCLCHGHASACQPPAAGGRVSPVCECQHRTNGSNCDSCQDLFNDRPWAPADGRQANECAPCNCSGRAESCFFDSSVYESSGDKRSGGVCLGCRNSIGAACQRCRAFSFRDGESCRACDCNQSGSISNLCDQATGQCDCLTGFRGRDCGTASS